MVRIAVMHSDRFPRLSALGVICGMIFATSVCAAPLSVTDQKGRAIEIEVVSLAGDAVTFRRAGSAKEFTLPLSDFAAPSQDLIRKEASQIPVVLPKIQPDVTIGKRRSKGDSYYMVKQEITCTVKLTNPSLTTAIPEVAGKILFIGQDRRTPELLEILSTQSLEASIKPGETFVKEMEAFITSYDSDNKGVGNVGGSQYIGYILVMTDAAGNVVVSQSLTASLRQEFENKPAILKELLKYPKGKVLTEKLDPAPVAGNLRVR